MARDDADVFVLACFSDPGLHAVREAVGGRPVMGIAEWGILRALTLAERFGIIALSPSSIRRQQRMIRQMGVEARCAGIWSVSANAADIADAAIRARLIAAITPSRPRADHVFDRPGRLVLPGLLNLHNHCFSEAVARSHTEDRNGRKNNKSIVYTVLLPLTKRGIDILSPAERMDIARLGILQLLRRGATTVMEPFRNGIPEMFDAAEEMGIHFYGAPYLFSTSDVSRAIDPGSFVPQRP